MLPGTSFKTVKTYKNMFFNFNANKCYVQCNLLTLRMEGSDKHLISQFPTGQTPIRLDQAENCPMAVINQFLSVSLSSPLATTYLILQDAAFLRLPIPLSDL
ncbi:hypothetical protein ILYODFUR_016330 [Ilyodon furcidens]|uniref:Uncharacterized protein n=1 Tax=Ilyodon furcidens TaxID=33524 RepID=A0ABV0TJ44_9TELE